MPYSDHQLEDDLVASERKWVFTGAVMLSSIAGFVNVSLLEFFTVPVSHMSGAISRISMDIGTGNMSDLNVILSIVAGFLSGAILSGMIIGGRQLKPGRRYGVVIIMEGLILMLSTILLVSGNFWGVALTALACGLQNAMASSYYGLVIRTTHVTGIVTDIGMMLGQWIRYDDLKPWKIALLILILLGFLIGGIAGNLLFGWMGMSALLFPSVVCLISGSIYYAWRQQKKPQSQ